MNATLRASKTLGLSVARLADYRVRIPPGGKTAALVQTLISWQSGDDNDAFSTLGVHRDQLGAAVIATEKMLNAQATRKKRPAPRKKKVTRKR
jgi:D-citramalate synthase